MRAGKVEYCRVEDTEEHVTKNTQLLSADYSWGTMKCWQSTAACGGNRYQFPHQLWQRPLSPLKIDAKHKEKPTQLSTANEEYQQYNLITNPENTNQQDIKHSASLLFAKVEYMRRLATSPEIYKWDRCVFSVDPLNLSSGWSGIDFWQNTKWKMQWAFPRVHKCIPSFFKAHSETLEPAQNRSDAEVPASRTYSL